MVYGDSIIILYILIFDKRYLWYNYTISSFYFYKNLQIYRFYAGSD